MTTLNNGKPTQMNEGSAPLRGGSVGFDASPEFLEVRDEAEKEIGWHLHMEWMRATIRHALSAGASKANVAAEIGVPSRRVSAFLRGGHLYADAAEPFVRWCNGRPSQPYHAEQAALAMLVADFFLYARPYARASLGRALEQGYVSRKDRVPQWLLDELQAGPTPG